MERSAYILFALLLATSSLALYGVQTSKGTQSNFSDSIVIWDVPSEEVTSFSFSSELFEIQIVAKEDPFGRFWEAKSSRRISQDLLKNSNHKFGHLDPDITIVEESDTIQTRTKNFVVGLTGRSFLENMAPLRVKAVISNSETREHEFGFGKKAGTFTIEAGTKKRSYDIGNTGYGSHVRYIKDEHGKIYALEERLFSALLSADKKFEGKIVFARESADLISFKIKSPNPLLMNQIWRGEMSYWAVNNTKEESVRIKSWIESKLLTMTGMGFVPKKLQPEGLETLLEFEMELRGVDKKIAGKFFRKNSEVRPVYFLQTDLTRQLVKMNSTQVVDLIASLETLE